jgi:hypothetical protein
MKYAPQEFLLSHDFSDSIQNTLSGDRAAAAEAIAMHLRLELVNEFGAPKLKGTEALSLSLFLLFIDVLGEECKTDALAEIFGIVPLSCKNWIGRLRKECMCDVEWVKDPVARGNIGQFVVKSWGIFDKSVYMPFVPYANLVINNWKLSNDQSNPAYR